jgi:hypothetical protein
MTTLHLGVTDDLPYAHGGKSVFDVASILEFRYGIMQFFFDTHQQEIVDELGDAIVGSFESALQGAPVSPQPYAAASSEIEKMFNLFLDRKEMDNKVAGVPTAASLGGVSVRFKQKQKKSRGARPSFVNSGLYENSFRVWVD